MFYGKCYKKRSKRNDSDSLEQDFRVFAFESLLEGIS